ncbi:hypothetical protein HMPREF9104_02674 [Lentilactobacillus kisonensis F0435]|uniref:Uncharacterized protein n=1 Tax=Lentilactobacillus kisonensis F0435 TaxID=797516 RepID=H1LJ82_9LACO|nr:hypothetical protein HMPREF9104_02674 [Lentilactobacillus kisonensis F0435]
MDAKTNNRFRPNRSDNDPIDKAPTDEPIKTEETMKPVCSVPKLKLLSINGEAPEIIPVSNPNKRPPKAPKKKIKKVLKCFALKMIPPQKKIIYTYKLSIILF